MKVATQNKINNLKRKPQLRKANRIRSNLFSLAKDEISEQKEQVNNCFSFSNKSFEEKNDLEKEIKKEEPKSIVKQISISSQKTSIDSSSDLSDFEEDSSDMSCEEEEEI